MQAQNPIIRDQFTADPTARVFNNKVYLYPSHDIVPPAGQRQDWFCMEDYHVFSSENLTDWTDHGVIVTQNKVPWVRPDSYSMWAPDCVERNGKYYFYFPSAPKDGRGFGIGVAVADRPEGPFAFEYNGNYYLTYPYVRENTEVLGYAMSKNPMGPYEYKGLIMPEHENGCWTNHHSIINYKGQWYLFYHQNAFSPRDDKRRSVQIDKLFFNPDGTIKEVKKTMRGVGVNKATEKIEIDRYSTASSDVTTSLIDTVNTFRGYQASLPKKGSWLHYADVDFSPITDAYLIVNAKAGGNTEFCVREKNAKGKVIARVTMNVVTQMGQFRRDQSNQWLTQTVNLEYVPKGVTDLCVTCEGDAEVSINWVQFKNRNSYFQPVAANAAAAQPDANGFIRRWMLLEPIDYNVRSNTILTDSYLNENLAKQYFKGQFDDKKLPRDGEKVNAIGIAVAGGPADTRMQTGPAATKEVKQTLKWHAVESESYNVKVFRFAEANGCQPYNSLFWGVTIIDCPEEIDGVRLAIGSNGASMWWLNGDRALTLDGDRRMVEDDCVSQRLTLKKGRNVLRFALVNGPGLSDLCARFIDEKGNPVKNYSIKVQ